MDKKTISEINEIYYFELAKVVKNIIEKKAKKVLLQFPEGLKIYSDVIVEELEGTGCQCFIWMGDCFGGGDIPLVDKMNIDLIVQFGHSKWEFEN